MTEKLKRLMHERAALPEFDLPDVDHLVAAGTRRARRRTGSVVAGGLASLAVIGGVVATVQLAGDDRPRGEDQVAAPTPTREVSWASGSTIHLGDATLEVGRRVEAFVSTADGFVFASGGDVYEADGTDVQKIGQIDRQRPHLVADEDGSLAGWVQRGGEDPAYAVHDLAEGVTSVNSMPLPAGGGGDQPGAYFYAIDDDTAYWLEERGVVAVDLGSGDVAVLFPVPSETFTITDVETDTLAFQLPDTGDAGIAGTFVGGPDDAVSLPEAYGDSGALSPDARWYSSDADEPTVYDVASGERVSFDLTGFATGYEWLDQDTLVMIAAEQDTGPVDLLTCEVPAGTCEVAVDDLGTFEELERSFALPVGVRLGS